MFLNNNKMKQWYFGSGTQFVPQNCLKTELNNLLKKQIVQQVGCSKIECILKFYRNIWLVNCIFHKSKIRDITLNSVSIRNWWIMFFASRSATLFFFSFTFFYNVLKKYFLILNYVYCVKYLTFVSCNS